MHTPVRRAPSQGTAGAGDAAHESRAQGDGSQHLQVISRASQPQHLRRISGSSKGASPMLLRSRSLLGQDSRSSEPGPQPRLTPYFSAGPTRDQLPRV
ncbi:hypothetical protein NDU88_006952 [Pleurodeles waltl]|uniref:Uncharacterized protein n=1 Tax=Pleurodeles waltl TaxID=8319 RepID=A0AAV7TYL0_PLEWA|nr:hypothetical protein NDU88_006952 [Pleurodeles waltl]